MDKKSFVRIGLACLTASALLLQGCAPAQTPAAPTPTQAPPATIAETLPPASAAAASTATTLAPSAIVLLGGRNAT